MCSRHEQLLHVIGVGPQWATTHVRHKATVAYYRLNIEHNILHRTSLLKQLLSPSKVVTKGTETV